MRLPWKRGNGSRAPVRFPSRAVFAAYCEDLAAGFLRRRGYRILSRNYRTRGGEIDIVAAAGKEIVFVEVKGKRGEDFGTPEEMVDRRKMACIVSAALVYLGGAETESAGCRFDVITVRHSPAGSIIEHVKGAFDARGL